MHLCSHVLCPLPTKLTSEIILTSPKSALFPFFIVFIAQFSTCIKCSDMVRWLFTLPECHVASSPVAGSHIPARGKHSYRQLVPMLNDPQSVSPRGQLHLSWLPADHPGWGVRGIVHLSAQPCCLTIAHSVFTFLAGVKSERS